MVQEDERSGPGLILEHITLQLPANVILKNPASNPRPYHQEDPFPNPHILNPTVPIPLQHPFPAVLTLKWLQTFPIALIQEKVPNILLHLRFHLVMLCYCL